MVREFEWTWRLRLSYLWTILFLPLMMSPIIGITIWATIRNVGFGLDATACANSSTRNEILGWFVGCILMIQLEILSAIGGSYIKHRDWMTEHTTEKSTYTSIPDRDTI